MLRQIRKLTVRRRPFLRQRKNKCREDGRRVLSPQELNLFYVTSTLMIPRLFVPIIIVTFT